MIECEFNNIKHANIICVQTSNMMRLLDIAYLDNEE
jgi:hypothetical protein